MEWKFRVLDPSEKSKILEFETRDLLQGSQDDPLPQIAAWTASWRPEALDHYLPLGWSFGAWDRDDNLSGYFLAQPLLFFKGQTQVLWVEWVSSPDPMLRRQLRELAIRWGRDKHLQDVIFHQDKV